MKAVLTYVFLLVLSKKKIKEITEKALEKKFSAVLSKGIYF